MNKILSRSFNLIFLAVIFLAGSTVYAQIRPYRVTDLQVRALLSRIETRTDSFRRQVDNDLDNGRRNGTRFEERTDEFITDFENATDSLKRNFDERDSTSADVQEVLNRAVVINNLIQRNRFSTATQNQWNLLRRDLDTLANYYRVSRNWNSPMTPNYPNYPNDRSSLTGTYTLNERQSDNVDNMVVQAIGNNRYNANQYDRVRRNLSRRLTSPERIAIEQNNRQFMIASSLSPQVTVNANGVRETETSPNGRTVNVTASTTYDNGLTINYEGDRMNDFYVSFEPLSRDQMRVTRRVYLENRNETVTVKSIYDRTSSIAEWSGLGNQNTGWNDNGNYNDFIVPNNTQMTAALTSVISTKESQDGDNFTMEVTSPSQYRGAIIQGHITKAERSGIFTGRANIVLDFDTIRLRNGQTYRFAGLVDQVTLPDGEKVSVSNEGNVREDSQTKKTVTRAGIGAGIGAIIGAIAGGGKGAVIGAGIGAGAGAGSVVLQGRDNLQLNRGTEFSITSTAPNNMGYNR